MRQKEIISLNVLYKPKATGENLFDSFDVVGFDFLIFIWKTSGLWRYGFSTQSGGAGDSNG